MAGLTVLDASILLAHLDPPDAHSDDATRILAESGELFASVVTLGEVLVGAVRAERLDEQLQALLSILEIAAVPLGRDSPAVLARLRVETKLRMPDCCVLYAAQAVRADAVGTRDARLAAAARARGLQTP